MFKPGDILAFYGTTAAERFIRFVTFGPSHVGIVTDWMTQHERLKVLFESTSLGAGDCMFAGKPVAGVQLHDPMQRIGQYVAAGGRVDVWRLTWQRALDDEDRMKLESLTRGYLQRGVGYDTGGAVLSGGRVLTLLDLIPVNRQEVFCSKLLHEILEALRLVSPDKSGRYNPAKLMRKLYREETYRKLGTINGDNFEEVAKGEIAICSR